MRLAKKYRKAGPISDTQLPQLVKDFKDYTIPDQLPRLFFHLNQTAFNPETRFPAIADSLKVLNPEVDDLNFSWQPAGSNGWIIDMGNNPGLSDITPLCGLNIMMLNAGNTQNPDLSLITEPGMVELRLGSTQLNHLFDLDQFTSLQSLDISRTNIRNLNNILKYSKLRSLDISGIEELSITSNLLWLRNLKMLTVSAAFRDDRTIKLLAQRGVIIIYTDE
jgi:hypothetical protein